MRTITLIALIMSASVVFSQSPRKITGEGIEGGLLRYENFQSKYVAARNVDVWLPKDYSNEKKYAVLYMHDGQNLFNPKESYGGVDWGMDETISRLMREKKIRDTVVVGVWNTPKRFEEYMPQKAFTMMNSDQLADYLKVSRSEAVLSDSYLKFLVTELKPFVDEHYSTRRGRADTAVMGSSMGGLISLYAISEYPNIFGGAGCVSTHLPIGNGVVIEYMRSSLPPPKGHKIYFDFGTEALDAQYEPFQTKADKVMRAKGYTAKTWITRKFEGDDHSERSWRKRVDVPLQFLLGK